jgi:hypothetical protein
VETQTGQKQGSEEENLGIDMKLIPELVPKSAWRKNLRSELPRSQWDTLRRAVYAACDNHCEICNGQGRRHPVECHEVWDYNEETGTQTLVKMIGICPACHEVKHIGLAQIRGRLNQAIRQMCKVNNINTVEAHIVIEDATRMWLRRSKISWVLDMTALEKYGVKNV